jgi:hypothetical protein
VSTYCETPINESINIFVFVLLKLFIMSDHFAHNLKCQRKQLRKMLNLVVDGWLGWNRVFPLRMHRCFDHLDSVVVVVVFVCSLHSVYSHVIDLIEFDVTSYVADW